MTENQAIQICANCRPTQGVKCNPGHLFRRLSDVQTHEGLFIGVTRFCSLPALCTRGEESDSTSVVAELFVCSKQKWT